MAKKWTADHALVDSVSSAIVELLALLPKRLVRTDALIKAHGMPFSQVQIMVLLSQGPMSIGEISAKLSIAKPNITPLVDRLFESGYVDRQHDENDRRVVNIVLKPQGEEKLAAIRATIARQIQSQSEDLTVSEFRELSESLQSIVRILSSL